MILGDRLLLLHKTYKRLAMYMLESVLNSKAKKAYLISTMSSMWLHSHEQIEVQFAPLLHFSL